MVVWLTGIQYYLLHVLVVFSSFQRSLTFPLYSSARHSMTQYVSVECYYRQYYNVLLMIFPTVAYRTECTQEAGSRRGINGTTRRHLSR